MFVNEIHGNRRTTHSQAGQIGKLLDQPDRKSDDVVSVELAVAESGKKQSQEVVDTEIQAVLLCTNLSRDAARAILSLDGKIKILNSRTPGPSQIDLISRQSTCNWPDPDTNRSPPHS